MLGQHTWQGGPNVVSISPPSEKRGKVRKNFEFFPAAQAGIGISGRNPLLTICKEHPGRKKGEKILVPVHFFGERTASEGRRFGRGVEAAIGAAGA